MMYLSKKQQFPLYDSLTLQIVVSDNVKKINKKLNAEEENYFACVWKSNTINKNCKTIVVVFNPCNRDNKITPGIITHEAIHIKNILFSTIGIHSDVDNDEPEAYLTEWIVNEIYKVFRKLDKDVYKNIRI